MTAPWRRTASDLLGWFALVPLAALLVAGFWMTVVLIFSIGG